MASEKGIYWVAVGIMGLLLGNSLAARQHSLYDRASQRVLAAAQQVVGEATMHLDAAIITMNHPGYRPIVSEVALVHAQSQLASVQGKLACKEAVLAHLQARQQREMALAQVREATRACLRQSLRVKVAVPED